MLPWLVGAGFLYVGYKLLSSDDNDDDDYEECIYCSRREYRDGLCRKHYMEKLREREERSRKREIESEIQSFKENSKRQIKNKYGVDISYSNSDVIISNSKKGKIKDLEDHISKVRAENKNIENLIKDLQRAKNEI